MEPYAKAPSQTGTNFRFGSPRNRISTWSIKNSWSAQVNLPGRPLAVVQSLSCFWIFVTPRTAACQASLSFTISQSFIKPMSIESVMPSNHLILVSPFPSCPQSFLASGSFPMNWLFRSGGQNIRAIASASVLPVNIQGWLPLGFTHLIFLLSKGPSRGFFNTTVKKHQFFSSQLSLWSNSHIHTWLLEKP